ncbi:PAS domain S-box-containing protein [Desulfotomaculum arcticum]|uniref:PAS domain S-box-containing protein n=1 Tax=Desulfotruncus arcticus DSM 17038 TaxID=1121424 RepID=A0A1I2UGD5_9FIRM|nr:sigma 54-interacting transcriptional regulator [Desulfotruncus arcticus]SFG75439.1 PAS domain S-box-containing protein [Desulfotomaculum arcticum] [Desulfotruncus arcticus DSM 17038]
MANKISNQSFTREELLQAMVETPHEAIIFVDTGGIIRLINEGYAEFLGYRPEQLVNRHILEIVPQTQLLEVLKTGKPQYGDIWAINGQRVVVTRLPIEKDGQIIGVLGRSMFRDEIALALDFAQKIKKLEEQLASYRAELDHARRAKYEVDEIIGNSDKMLKLKNRIFKVAKTSSTVLITGDSGTGKELFAHAIHNASNRRNRAFVRVNCTSIPMDLLESELFGYDEGAFTGAKRGGKLGKFEIAQGGTIFLDEIGDMDRSMQAKLLRVLQEKEIERIGGTKPVPVDVRVIAATNRNLEEMMQTNQFREDLYYRLNVVLFQVPPLRERKEDIPGLTSELIKKLNKRLGAAITGLNQETMEMFLSYDWPGNVRELENLLEQAINLAENKILYRFDFPVLNKRLQRQLEGHSVSGTVRPLHEVVKEAEKKAILKALNATDNNKKEAARLLEIHRSVLYRKLERID